jgi:hypothetical protein
VSTFLKVFLDFAVFKHIDQFREIEGIQIDSFFQQFRLASSERVPTAPTAFFAIDAGQIHADFPCSSFFGSVRRHMNAQHGIMGFFSAAVLRADGRQQSFSPSSG